MHIWPAKGSTQTAGDLVRQYALTVLSIVTALALEQALVAWRQHEGAQAAASEIEAEVRANLVEIRKAGAANRAQMKPLAALSAELGGAIKSGRTKDDIVAHVIQPSARQLRLGFEWPLLQREAWERAVASQAATAIDARRQGRFSAAYAAQRDVPPLAYQAFGMLLNGSRLVDAVVDAQLGQVDPLEYLRVISQYGVALQAAQGTLGELEQQLAAAVPGEPGAAPAAVPGEPAAKPAATGEPAAEPAATGGSASPGAAASAAAR